LISSCSSLEDPVKVFSEVILKRINVNKALSSTLEVVLRQVRVPIPQSKILQREYQDWLLDSVPIERGLLVSIISSLSPTPFHLCRFKIYNEKGQKMVRIERSFPKRERN